MSETVKITLELPAPPEGYEWGAPDGPGPGTLVTSSMAGFTYYVPLRRIAPATVTVTLLREDAERLEHDLNLNDTGVLVWYARVKASLRAELG
jgi:hypothetical protein